MTGKKEAETGVFRVGFHAGNVLTYLSHQYDDIRKVLVEIIQNAIDAGATRTLLILDLSRRSLKSFDDGCGASKDEMRDRVKNIGARRKGTGQIGEKGIGNLAPAAICEHYRLVTRPQGGDGPFFEMRIDPAHFGDREEVAFEYADIPQFSFPSEVSGFSTHLDVRQIDPSALRELANQPETAATKLAEFVSNTFSAKILETGIRLQIRVLHGKRGLWEKEVKPLEFPGTPDEYTIPTRCGPVTFQMYMSWDRVSRPVVLVEHQGRQAFPLKNLREVWPQIKGFFASGHIQGRVSLDFCTLAASRTRLMHGEELDAFHESLARYVEDRGEPWLSSLRSRQRSSRFERIAEKAIQAVETSFQDSGLPESFLAPPRVEEPKKKRKKKRKKAPKPPEEEPEEEPETPEGDKPKRDPKKPKRDPKKPPEPTGEATGQLGLRVLFGQGSPELRWEWHVRLGEEGDEKGAVVLNIGHPDFTEAEQRGDSHLQAYMQWYLVALVLGEKMPGIRKIAWKDIYEKDLAAHLAILLSR